MSDGAETAEGDLYPLVVVIADLRIYFFDELLDRSGLSAPRVEQFGFQAAEEALACSVIGRAALARHRSTPLRVTDPGEPTRPAIVGGTIRVNDR